MNIFARAYCRSFQAVFKLALPFLPYRDPKIIQRVGDIPQVLHNEGKKKPLIVTDKTVRSLGLTAPLEKALEENELGCVIYDGVAANPTTDHVAAALALYRSEGCDSLIAVGGGSPMDCAKAVGALVARPNKSPDELKGILKVRKKIPLLIALPTTAGTGSETTLACVIVNGQTRHKYAINDFPLIPSYAVLDESVTATLPSKVAAETGMDALTHAIEAYIGRSGNQSTRRDALEAMRLIFENIESAVTKKTQSARKNMLTAAHKAGRAFSKAYVGYVHAIAHSLGGKYDIPHGLANAVILPIVLREYGKAAHKKLRQIAVYCSLADNGCTPAEGAEAVIARIEELNRKFAIPRNLPVKGEDVEELARHAAKEANPLYPVPVLWNKNQLKKLYFKVGMTDE